MRNGSRKPEHGPSSRLRFEADPGTSGQVGPKSTFPPKKKKQPQKIHSQQEPSVLQEEEKRQLARILPTFLTHLPLRDMLARSPQTASTASTVNRPAPLTVCEAMIRRPLKTVPVQRKKHLVHPAKRRRGMRKS